MRVLVMIAIVLAAIVSDPAAGQRHTACELFPGGLASPGFGAILGVTITCPGNRISAGYQVNAGGVRLDYLGRLHSLSLHVQAVSSEFQWFYGLGNATPFNDDSGFGPKYYRVRQSYFEVTPGWTLRVAPYTDVTLGPDVRYWETSHAGGFVDSTRPYGIGPFGTLGGRLDARVRTRLVEFDVIGRGVPHAWDAQQAYGTVSSSIGARIPFSASPLAPTFDGRLTAEKTWGRAPFQDLAHMEVRGYYPERYTGDASTFANAQIRVPLGHADLFGPLIVGVLAINDVGRVFEPGDHSSVWHDGFGGGLFGQPADRRYTASVSLVRGSEGTRAYIRFSLHANRVAEP